MALALCNVADAELQLGRLSVRRVEPARRTRDEHEGRRQNGGQRSPSTSPSSSRSLGKDARGSTSRRSGLATAGQARLGSERLRRPVRADVDPFSRRSAPTRTPRSSAGGSCRSTRRRPSRSPQSATRTELPIGTRVGSVSARSCTSRSRTRRASARASISSPRSSTGSSAASASSLRRASARTSRGRRARHCGAVGNAAVSVGRCSLSIRRLVSDQTSPLQIRDPARRDEEHDVVPRPCTPPERATKANGRSQGQSLSAASNS